MMRTRQGHSTRLALLSCLVLALSGLSARARVSAWLDFGGAIPGDSTDPQHGNWIDIIGFSVGSGRAISAIISGGNREASNPSISEVAISKLVDSASPHLFAAAVAGQTPYPIVTIDLNSSASIPLARLEMEDVLLSAQSISAATGDSKATESVSLNFRKITYIYIFPDSGTAFSSYDLLNQEATSGITPGVINPDTDNDGMPDSWETANGLSVGTNDADGDLDGDGLSNLAEFQLGTNPKSGNSFFKAQLTADPVNPGNSQLTWNSVAGKTYVIEWSPDLAIPFATLRTVTATATSTTEIITRAGALGFYRVRPQ